GLAKDGSSRTKGLNKRIARDVSRSMAMNANVLAFPAPREASNSCGIVRGRRAKEEVLSPGELSREQERINLLLEVPRRALSNAPLSDVLKVAAMGARHVTRSD